MMRDDDLRATVEYLCQLAQQARDEGKPVRATALELMAEDYEAELAAAAAV